MLIVGAGALEAAEQPNILWIITDDQRPDSLAIFNEATRGEAVGPLGPVSSPHIDRLAREGVLFTRIYCNSPACAPSRASMHTGRYPFRSGIYGFEQTHDQTDTYRPTIPEILSSQGYLTATFGKFGLYLFRWGPGQTWEKTGIYDVDVDMKADFQRKGRTDYHRDAMWQDGKRVGIEEFWYFPDGVSRKFILDIDDPGTVMSISPGTREQRRELFQELEILVLRDAFPLIIGGVSPQPAGQTLNGEIAAEFIRFLDAAGGTYDSVRGGSQSGAPLDQSLFAHLSFLFPHTPVLPPAEFRSRFDADDYRIPEFDPKELEHLPPQLRLLHERMQFALPEEQMRRAIRDYYALCAYGDDLIGQSIEAFKAYSERKGQPYLIVYVCGDHSWHLGENGIMAKFGPYEQSNRNAAIVVSSNPDSPFTAGTTYDDFTEFVDFAPTIYAAAGIDLSDPALDHLDGYALQDVLGGTAPRRDYVLGELNHVFGPRAYIRTRDFVFSMRTRRHGGRPGQHYALGEDLDWALRTSRRNAELALFDLRVDPLERWNVADHPNYIALADFFRERLGAIVLGDRRLEVDWRHENEWHLSTFAEGADDKRLNIPESIIPHGNAADSVVR